MLAWRPAGHRSRLTECIYRAGFELLSCKVLMSDPGQTRTSTDVTAEYALPP
jgi:hypothetical protein